MIVAYADCKRCGAPAFPISGYCSRACAEFHAEELKSRERHRRHCFGVRFFGECTCAFAVKGLVNTR